MTTAPSRRLFSLCNCGLSHGTELDRRSLAFYPHGYHMLLRDLHASVVRRDVVAWIFEPEIALPSKADQRAERLLRGNTDGLTAAASLPTPLPATR